MSAAQVIDRIDQSIANHRDAGNGEIAHDLCCLRLRIAAGSESVTWKNVSLPNRQGIALLDGGKWVASV